MHLRSDLRAAWPKRFRLEALRLVKAVVDAPGQLDDGWKILRQVRRYPRILDRIDHDMLAAAHDRAIERQHRQLEQPPAEDVGVMGHDDRAASVHDAQRRRCPEVGRIELNEVGLQPPEVFPHRRADRLRLDDTLGPAADDGDVAVLFDAVVGRRVVDEHGHAVLARHAARDIGCVLFDTPKLRRVVLADDDNVLFNIHLECMAPQLENKPCWPRPAS